MDGWKDTNPSVTNCELHGARALRGPRVTLYLEQWTRLLDLADDIRAFIKENEGKLKKKE